MSAEQYLSPETAAIMRRWEEEQRAKEAEWYEQRARERERTAARMSGRPTPDEEKAARLEKAMARRYRFECGGSWDNQPPRRR